ncbi:MAG: beta-N-acetylhexosaminidase [Clostridia bacterium]|nr:beta-N-acetylhexosaminidase [Clostridia bacterium]
MERLKLIPYPKNVEIFDGTLDCKTLKLCGQDCFAAADFMEKAKKSGVDFSQESGVEIKYYADCSDIADAEGYELTVSADGIEIRASSQAGLLYGFCSLRQLLFNYGNALPYCKIQDEPYLKYRGLLFDVGRYFFEKKDVFAILDFCLLHKINVLHWHLTEDQGWRIEIDKYPLLTQKGSKRSHTNFGVRPHGGFYSKNDIREIVAYANERNIQVIPEIDMPGHIQSALACYPYLGCFDRKLKVATHWGVKHDPLCVGKESTYEFVFDVLEEVIELFGKNTKYIHIGGDEVFRHRWKLCEHCQSILEKEGLKDEEELQMYFMRRVSEWVVDKGYIPIMWNGLNSDKVVHPQGVWHFWSDERGGNNDVVIRSAKNSGGYINGNSAYSYLDFPYGWLSVKKAYEYQPLPEGFPEDKFVGSEISLWTEYVPNFKTACARLLPRACASSEAMWLEGKKDYVEFENRLKSMVKYLETQGYKSCSLKKANPSKLRGGLQSAWFNRRVLHWQGLHNLIDDAYVERKFSKKRKRKQ